jgi:glycerol kinase
LYVIFEKLNTTIVTSSTVELPYILDKVDGLEKEGYPAMDAERRKKLYSGWKKAVTRTFDWVE